MPCSPGPRAPAGCSEPQCRACAHPSAAVQLGEPDSASPGVRDQAPHCTALPLHRLQLPGAGEHCPSAGPWSPVPGSPKETFLCGAGGEDRDGCAMPALPGPREEASPGPGGWKRRALWAGRRQGLQQCKEQAPAQVCPWQWALRRPGLGEPLVPGAGWSGEHREGHPGTALAIQTCAEPQRPALCSPCLAKSCGRRGGCIMEERARAGCAAPFSSALGETSSSSPW